MLGCGKWSIPSLYIVARWIELAESQCWQPIFGHSLQIWVHIGLIPSYFMFLGGCLMLSVSFFQKFHCLGSSIANFMVETDMFIGYYIKKNYCAAKTQFVGVLKKKTVYICFLKPPKFLWDPEVLTLKIHTFLAFSFHGEIDHFPPWNLPHWKLYKPLISMCLFFS